MVRLYKPNPGDLWFREKLLSDPETMAYNHAWGGVIGFPPSKWMSWYDRWLADAEGRHFYRYLQHDEGRFVGEAALHLDPYRKIWLADLIVHASERHHGYGTEGLQLLCEAAGDMGILLLYDEIAPDNPSIRMFEKCGFHRVSADAQGILVCRDLRDKP